MAESKLVLTDSGGFKTTALGIPCLTLQLRTTDYGYRRTNTIVGNDTEAIPMLPLTYWRTVGKRDESLGCGMENIQRIADIVQERIK